jgi:hypothetical protein
MMTLGRFRVLLDSYGADPQRWPQGSRADAQKLLSSSTAARAMREEAERLDAAIAAATAREDATLARLSPPDAALQRLRSRVAARIATEARRPTEQRMAWMLAAGVERLLSPALFSSRLQWAGMATAGGFAIVAGLLLGAMYATPPAADSVLSMLQSAPIVILAD